MKKFLLTILLAPFVLSACASDIEIQPEAIDDVVDAVDNIQDTMQETGTPDKDELLDFADKFNEVIGLYNANTVFADGPIAYLKEVSELSWNVAFEMQAERTNDSEGQFVREYQNYPKTGARQVIEQKVDDTIMEVEVLRTNTNRFFGDAYVKLQDVWYQGGQYAGSAPFDPLGGHLQAMAQEWGWGNVVESGDSDHDCGMHTCVLYVVDNVKNIRFHFEPVQGALYKVEQITSDYDVVTTYDYDTTPVDFDFPEKKPETTADDQLGMDY